MPSTTRLLGIVLVVLGIAGYFGTGRTSVTALIPAFFGAVFILLGLLAKKEAARKHAMHVAALLAVLGFLGTAGRLIPALADGLIGRPAVLAQLAMSLLLVGYIVLSVNSFIKARRLRKS